MSNIKTAFLETRPQFLILSITLILVGSTAAFYQGAHHIPHMILALFGLIAFHISVNALNDYDDFKTGIDLNTKRTPFSGGSGMLPSGEISPKLVWRMGIISLCIGTIIGLIQMLANLQDQAQIASGMAVALLTTFYGATAAYLVFLPIAGKLKRRSESEILIKEIIIRGVLLLQSGTTPSIMPPAV